MEWRLMPEDLSILKELITDNALVAIKVGSYGKPQATLIEPECEDHSEYSVDIANIPHDSIVIKLDTFPAPRHIFNCSKGECKRADYVIITNMNHKNLIVFIELKKGKGKTKEIIQQLKGSQCVVDYLKAIAKVFWKKADFLDARCYEYRFVSIHYIGTNKKPAFDSHFGGIHNQAERPLKILAPRNLQFKSLI